MVPRVSPSYATWWIGVHPKDIGMDEDDEDEEEEEAVREGSSKDDTYQLNNPIHDIPLQEGEASGAPRLAILAAIIPLVALDK